MMTSTNTRLPRLFVGAAASVLLAGTLVGCSNGPERVEHKYYPGHDITPVAESSLGSSDEIDRTVTFTFDTNLRRLQDDVHRMFLLDAPSTLSPKRGIWY